MRKQDREELNRKIKTFLKEKIDYHSLMIASLPYNDLAWEQLSRFEYPYDKNYVIKWYIDKYRNIFPYDAMIYCKKHLT